MDWNFKRFIFSCAVLYVLLNTVSFSFANKSLPVCILLFFTVKFLKAYITKKRAQHCFSAVPKHLKSGENTLKNTFCTVKYTPNKKIVVSDNPEIKGKLSLRSFTVSKENYNNVDKCWLEICSIFDEYMYLDNLFSYIDKQTGSINITYEQSKKADVLPKDNPILNSMNSKSKKSKKSALKTDNPQNIINFEDLSKTEEKLTNDKNYEIPVSDISEIGSKNTDLIDVNLSNADRLSQLPGINIILAKKIIDYRNKNGFFKDADEFLNISGVKEHFRQQIVKLISVTANNSEQNPDIAEEQERTVD